DKAAAWEKAIEFKEPEDGGPEGAPPKPGRKPDPLTLGKAADQYVEWFTANRRKSGARRSMPVVRMFVDRVGAATPARAVTREQVQEFVKWREDGRSAVTARNDFARIRALIYWVADRKGAMVKSIYNGIDFSADDSLTREAPALEKIKRVISKLRISSH